MRKSPSVLNRLSLLLSWLPFAAPTQARRLLVGQPAPVFELTAQNGSPMNLASRQGQGWTVLYFYPKAETPGCTRQACALRDAVQAIRQHHAEVYGISTDPVKRLQDFHQKHQLAFDLLSDPDAQVTEAYGVKMPMLPLAKRWTFILDPALVVRHIDAKVDPAQDAQRVVETLARLQKSQ
jgi:peroxiredoxin Q/BCP